MGNNISEKKFGKHSLWKEVLVKITRKYSKLSIIIIYNLVLIIASIPFYLLVPMLLNYPPDFIEVSKRQGLSYDLQYFTIIGFAAITGTIFLAWLLKGVSNWKLMVGQKEIVNKIRSKCINVPYLIYIVQMVLAMVPLIPIVIILPLVNSGLFSVSLKVAILVFSFLASVSIITFIFTKKVLFQILLQTYEEQNLEGFRIGLQKKIFLQVLPMFIVAILFTSIAGYSRLIDEKGDLIYKIYSNQLKDKFNVLNNEVIGDVEPIEKVLDKVELLGDNDCKFIITPDKNIVTSNGYKFSKMFIDYLNSKSAIQGARVYDTTGEIQGATINIKGAKGLWIVGIKFEVASDNAIIFFIVIFIILIILNLFILSYFSKSLSADISLVAENLTEIAEGEQVNLDKKIPVTSNDEIGDLVVAFNRIQELEKEHIKSIEEQQSQLVEQERLASLGQLIGGIAHNMKTPIMSLSGAVEALKDLAKEYDDSIDDEEVTKEDHHEIANEILTWAEKMGPYISYMSDMISAVKGQAVQMNASTNDKFTLEELVKRVDILMQHELKTNHCKLETNVKVSLNTEIKGEINTLIQIINNLIVNAIQSYEGQNGIVEFTIMENKNYVEFIIRDFGRGMSNGVQGKLFKEMITTKGKKGTGLGLYMSYSTIKGRFNGDMRFESEEGKGTAFYISVPFVMSSADDKEVEVQ